MEAILAESVSWARMKATLMGLASIFLIGLMSNLFSALAGRMARRRRVSISRGCFIFFGRFTLRQTCLRGGRAGLSIGFAVWSIGASRSMGGWATLGRCT